MKPAEHVAWFKSIVLSFDHIPKRPDGLHFYEPADAQAWVAEAEAALQSAFPPNHTCRVRWAKLIERFDPNDYHAGSLRDMFGVFGTALKLLTEGRLAGLLDAVRAETVDELLDQASALLGAKHLVAAAVIAGGALETHLRHLTARHGLTVSGDGSISKYNDAIAKARNDGTATVYSATDGKQVTSWGGIRNDAAHDPANFSRTADDVRRMIEGVREFIVRTS